MKNKSIRFLLIGLPVVIGTLLPVCMVAQNVGIGIATPDYRLHLYNANSSLLKLENSTSLAGDVTNDLLFKTGSRFTGAIKTIGTSTVDARLGFFTNASLVESGLLERFSILDNGNVGIGTSTPAFKLQVKGSSDASQLIINANITQSNLNPLIKLQNFGGIDLMWIHSDADVNTFVGLNAGRVNSFVSGISGDCNTFIGSDVGYFNNSGRRNTASGFTALLSNTSGSNNTAMGNASLLSNTTGNYNTVSGYNALWSNINGSNNTASGYNALYSNVAGCNATAIGSGAMENAYSTSSIFNNYNVAIGFEALKGPTPASLNSGNYNTAVGYQTLLNNSSGSNNTGCGWNAVLSNTTGSNNSAFGNNAYFTSSGLNNTTCIGYNSGGLVNVSNRIEIGNTSVSFIGGQVGFSTYSDERIKDNITSDVPGLSFISRLRPVTYNLNIHRENDMVYTGKKDDSNWPTKYDIEKIRMTGFLAQEVEQAAKETGYDFSGVQAPKDANGLYSLRYSDFVMPLVKAVQEQQTMIEKQNKTINEQTNTIQDLVKRINVLENKLK